MSAIMLVPWFGGGGGLYEKTSTTNIKISKNDWEHVYSPYVATPRGVELDAVFSFPDMRSWSGGVHLGFVLGAERNGQGIHCGDIKRGGENIWTDGFGTIVWVQPSKLYAQHERWTLKSPFLYLDPSDVSLGEFSSNPSSNECNIHIKLVRGDPFVEVTIREGGDYRTGGTRWSGTANLGSSALGNAYSGGPFVLPTRSRVCFFVIGPNFQSPNNNGCTERSGVTAGYSGKGWSMSKYRIKGL